MLALISFFAPSLISLNIDLNVSNNKTVKSKDIVNYGVYCLFNNIITIVIMYYFFNISFNLIESINSFSGVAVKYMVIAIVVSIILALVKIVYIRNVEVKIEVQKNINKNS